MNIDNLTPEQKRVLIAGFCGWKSVRACKSAQFGVAGYAPSDPFPHDLGEQSIPDHLNSLDAIHEAEKKLNPCDWGSYTMNLRRIIQRDCDRAECYVIGTDRSQLIADFWFYHATAAQRADALLLCLPEPVKP